MSGAVYKFTQTRYTGVWRRREICADPVYRYLAPFWSLRKTGIPAPGVQRVKMIFMVFITCVPIKFLLLSLIMYCISLQINNYTNVLFISVFRYLSRHPMLSPMQKANRGNCSFHFLDPTISKLELFFYKIGSVTRDEHNKWNCNLLKSNL